MGIKRISKVDNEKGISLIVVLLIIMVLLIIGASLFITTSTDLKIGGHYLESRQAFYAAEAGAHSVLAAYYTTPSNLSLKRSASAMGFATTKPSSANYGSNEAFWISELTYDTASNPTWVKIISHGTVIGSSSDASVILYVKPIYDSAFSFGAFANNGISMQGSGYFDSYDSRIAPWSLSTRRTDGTLGTNAITAGAITMSSTAAIYGNVNIGPGGIPSTVVSKGSSNIISGSITDLSSPRDMTPISDPGGGTSITITGSTTGQSISTGTYRASDFTLNGSNYVKINGNVTIYVTGNFTLASSTYISIPKGSSLTLVVSGKIDISSKVSSNESQLAQNLLIIGTSTCTTVSLTGSANMYAAVYAPNAAMTYNGSSAWYGSLIGQSLSIRGQGNIHYDEALTDIAIGTNLINFKILSWKDGAF